MKSIRHALGLTATLILLGPAAGCSRAPEAAAPESTAAPAPASPGSADGAVAREEAEPTTLAEAEALLERSRTEFDRVAMNTPAPPPPPAAGAPAPAQAPTPAAESAPKRAEKATAADEASASPRDKDSSGGCETACKAFSSLERASDAVCRLDADGGQRCERARRIRDDARVRVASCGCSK